MELPVETFVRGPIAVEFDAGVLFLFLVPSPRTSYFGLIGSIR